MRQGALGGAISAGIFNIIGGVSLPMKWGTSGLEKIALHGAGGGMTSWAMGGDFWSGAKGGAAAELFAQNIMGLTGLAGGTAAWASGSDFNLGALAAGFGMAFNQLGVGHEEDIMRKAISEELQAIKESAKNFANKGIRFVNKLNNTIHSNETRFIVAGYIATASRDPKLWGTLPFATTFEAYLDLYPPGGQPPSIPEFR
jgi:hypothetical protein